MHPVPASTYRLQMHAGFTLRAATAIISYLDSLGISHVYTSSLLAAKPGSTHGYDVIDHTRLNPEIGSDDDLQAFSRELKARNMGLLLDVVPNHMSSSGQNRWWQDVLENGPSSQYANYFDIAWNEHYREALRGKVLLPILGTTYGEATDSGEFQLHFDQGSLFFQFYEARLPIDPRTYAIVLDPVLEELKAAQQTLAPTTLELQSVLAAVRHLPPRTEADSQRLAEGRDEIVVVKRRLHEWSRHDEPGMAALTRRLGALSRDPAGLDVLIDAQAYRPCSWRVASDEINYRRFFDVNDLAALATERPEVFEDVHRLIFQWLDAGIVNGLRIDHPDGLYDPKHYLVRLQELWQAGGPGRPPLYIVVEKILGPREALPTAWACAGTTGYEFLNVVNSLFVDPAGEKDLSRTFADFTGFDTTFDELVYRKKYLILQSSLTSELHVLAGHFDRLAQSDRSSRDFTLNGLRHALREVLCSFPVYRSYVDGNVYEADQPSIVRAVVQARRRNPLLGRPVFDFLRDTLLLKDPPAGPASAEYRANQVRCAAKFQQLSAPVMAKGFEDTSLYIYNRLTSLNEVGGDPKIFGRKPAEVHASFQQRGNGNLSPLSTHDTKRGEDVRARINVLSEIPNEWAERVARWRQLNDALRPALDADSRAPDRAEEYFLYQTLVGAWNEPGPDFTRRIQEYMTKAIQEAKVNSSWINPDADYLKAVSQFVETILDPHQSREFREDLQAFVDRVRPHGTLNSLAQTLVRCTAPGVPDTYQGTEGLEFWLVDPDNRGAVDYAKRAGWLPASEPGAPAIESVADPRAKAFVIAKSLRLRRRWPAVFADGEYLPLAVEGPRADHVFAFLRRHDGHSCLVAVPRLTASLPLAANGFPDPACWEGVSIVLPDEVRTAAWIDELSGRPLAAEGGRVKVWELLAAFPAALCRSTT